MEDTSRPLHGSWMCETECCDTSKEFCNCGDCAACRPMKRRTKE